MVCEVLGVVVAASDAGAGRTNGATSRTNSLLVSIAAMNRTAAAIALGLLLVAATVVYLSAGDPVASVAGTGGGTPAAPGTSPPISEAPAPTNSTRRESEPSPSSTTQPSNLTVVAVDASGQPVAGAEVGHHVVRSSDDYSVSLDVRERLAWAGKIDETDVHDEVHLSDAGVLSWTVFARHDGQWGYVFVPIARARTPKTIELRPDITIRARVIDSSDRPVAGIHVALTDEGYVDRLTSGAFAMTKEPDGVATFEHAQTRVQPDWGEEGVVLLSCPTPQPVFESLRFAEPPAEPIVLRLPATGSMLITLVDEDKRPIRDPAGTVYASLRQQTKSGQRSFWLRFDGPRLELSHVGLGLSFRLVLNSPGVSGTLDFDGPKAWGERVEQFLVVDRHPTLSGRLVDEHGVPQKGYWYATHMQPARGYWNDYFETSEDGRFHVSIPKLFGNRKTRRGVLFRRTLPNRRQQAWIDLDRREVLPGRNELGDVVLRPAPVLVQGRVVDDTGSGVGNVRLNVYQGSEGDSWPVAGLDGDHDKSAADGSFEIRSHHIGEHLLLRGETEGNHGRLLPFDAGRRDLTYVLPRVGEAVMPLRLGDGVTARDLLFFRHNRRTGQTRAYVSHYVFAGDVVRWSGLHPAIYDFGVRMLGVPEPLVTITGIEIEGGKTTKLPAQELSPKLHTLHVTITDLAGNRVERANVVIDARPEDRLRAALPTKLGELTLRVPKLPVTLLVLAPGFRRKLVRGVADDVLIRLEPGLEVALEVKLPEGALKPDQQLLPTIRRYDPANPDPQPWNDTSHELYLRGAGARFYPSRHPWLWNQRRPLDEAGRVVIRVPGSGAYAIDWEIRGTNEHELSPAARRMFQVRESTTRQRVALELSRNDLR